MSTQCLTPGVIFDREKHAYTFEGRKLVSVTQVIEGEGLIEGVEYFTEESRERGSAVHEAIHFHVEGDLDESSLHPIVAPYFAGYLRFLRETRAEPLITEASLGHIDMGYAGTLDLVAWLPAIEEDTLFLVDFKTGAFAPWQCLQLAAYMELMKANGSILAMSPGELPVRRRICQLTKEGNYKLTDPLLTMSNAQAWAFFSSALNTRLFKERFHRG